MVYWWFHFENEIPINCLLTQWSEYIYIYILDLEPWRWSELNMGFVDKWSSRMQGQWFFEIGQVGDNFWSSPKIIDFMDGRLLPEYSSPQKFGGGGRGTHRPPSESFHGYQYGLKNILLNRACFFRSQGEHVHDRCTYLTLSIL